MNSYKICIVGLGYVGLPLAIEFGKKYNTIGFDLNNQRVKNLNKQIDLNSQVLKNEFVRAKHVKFTHNKKNLKKCNIFVITVPTPVDKKNKPDLQNLISATKLVGKNLSHGDVVIYESTVYPGATEEICVPILKKISKLNTNIKKDKKYFFYGYSPERLNPGSKQNDIKKIVKVTSGSNSKALKIIDNLYKSIIPAGTFKASSVKVAEAAKVIENTQRDVNIALINEFQKIFNKLKINTYDVLNASATKWNFLKFFPGLVGGHCISVDPYYLSYKSKLVGINPKMVLSGRETNNSMVKFYFEQIQKKIKKNQKTNILVMGVTFKENCPDIRNSGSLLLCKELKKNKLVNLSTTDYQISSIDYKYLKEFNFIKNPKKNSYDIIIVSVAHDKYKKLTKNFFNKYLINKNKFVFDLKNILNKDIDKVII